MALMAKISRAMQSISSGKNVNLVKYTLIGGVGIVSGYACYKGVTAAKAHFHRQKIGYFLGGFSTCILLGGGYILIRRYAFPTPERIVNQVLPMLRAHSEFRTIVGDNIRPGLFKAFAHVGGLSWKMPLSSGSSLLERLSPVKIDPRALQLMFQVNGTHSSAMVSLEVFRRTSEGLRFKSLAVDFANGERLLLKGTDENVVFKGVTRLR